MYYQHAQYVDNRIAYGAPEVGRNNNHPMLNVTGNPYSQELQQATYMPQNYWNAVDSTASCYASPQHLRQTTSSTWGYKNFY
uniref:Uncharacterized protein n=1 Tax=Acrobeloides nanus TaxID=290746 RepID=A0A914DVJ4_9BILA